MKTYQVTVTEANGQKATHTVNATTHKKALQIVLPYNASDFQEYPDFIETPYQKNYKTEFSGRTATVTPIHQPKA